MENLNLQRSFFFDNGIDENYKDLFERRKYFIRKELLHLELRYKFPNDKSYGMNEIFKQIN